MSNASKIAAGVAATLLMLPVLIAAAAGGEALDSQRRRANRSTFRNPQRLRSTRTPRPSVTTLVGGATCTPPSPPNNAGWVAPVTGRCTSGFGARSGEFHRGQDIAAPTGTPILAASSGRVIDSGPASGYGLWVRIGHAAGVITTYGHNNRNLVTTDQQVQAGEPIAEVGNRGTSTGPHLHFQLDAGGQSVDPAVFYQHQSAPPLCGSRTTPSQ